MHIAKELRLHYDFCENTKLGTSYVNSSLALPPLTGEIESCWLGKGGSSSSAGRLVA